ncbi:MAG: tetratricopeptide repeat protein, partial [Roseiflexaceae bacterium]|nr:tetratricopeptide repeat protein [Roseiflexaceae bacterium]
MSSTASLAETLRSMMRRPDLTLTPSNLSKLSRVSKATIVNWLDGLVEHPRRWQDLVKVADALRLAESDADRLLAAAGHASIAELHTNANSAADQLLLLPWRATISPVALPLARAPNLLPPATALIGRAHEQAALRDLLLRPTVRLVTLTGAGGSGKTLLALTVAAASAAAFADGVWHVSLAALTDPRLVVSSIAQVLGVGELPGLALTQQLADALRFRHMLLVLDNFEHLLEAAPPVAKLLIAAPQLKILVTSRAVLHLHEEYELPILPLALPDPHTPATAAAIERSPAVELFVQRATTRRAGFALTDANAQAVAAICTRLDGLPLAIELAASYIATQTPEQVLAQLARGLDTLRGDPNQLPERQQTLQATLEWSYTLLDAAARRLFIRLAIFMGGWTIATAEDICADEHNRGHQFGHWLRLPHEHPSTLDTLMTLADHSLIVRMESGEGTSRYMMLETIRVYASARLRMVGEFETIKQRHTAYYLRLAEQIEPELTGLGQVTALTYLEDEHDNLRAALQWAIDHQQAELACRLAAALWRFWLIRGYLSEGRRWLALALVTRQALPAPVEAKALLAAGRLARQQADLGYARAYLEAALALERERGDQHSMGFVLGSLGVVAYDQGDFARAHLLHAESLAIRRALGDTWGIAATLTNLGEVARQEGREADAQALHEQSLDLFRAQQDASGTAMALLNLGQIVRQRGDYQRAIPLLHESLRLWQQLGERVNVAECLEALAAIAVAQDQPVRAAQLGGTAATLRVSVGAPLA